MTLKRPSLRYYARFKGNDGHLRAVVRYDDIRKCITTPLVITRSQLPKLDTSGGLAIAPGNTSDALLHGRLKDYTAIVWRVVNPLIRSGRFATMSGKELTAAINEARTEAVKESHKRTMTRQGLKVEAMPEDAFQSGWHYTDGRLMSAEDIAKIEAILSKGPWPSYEDKNVNEDKKVSEDKNVNEDKQQGKEDDHEK